MKVLILNGSPKCEQSGTLKMSKAFSEGICSKGGEVRIIHAAAKRIEYCDGCFVCKKTGECVKNDDMADILSEIKDSDIVIFSFPLYCHSMPAALKSVIERTMPLTSERIVKGIDGKYHHAERENAKKQRFVMICGSGYPGSRQDFDNTEATFRRSFPQCDCVITVEESPLFNIKDAAPVADARLLLLEKAGEEYVRSGEVSVKTQKELAAPMIPEEIYMKFANGGK